MTTDQVRPVIECFCQILSFYGFSTITSETFRLAKFDRNAATLPLWRLTFEMIRFDPNKVTQQQSRQIFDQTPKDELVDMIKADLYKLGYAYDHVLFLDNQMEKGSRSLLVCLGWVIYHLKFIERCIEQHLKSLSPVYQYQTNKTSVPSDQSMKGLIRQMKQAARSNSKLRSHLYDLRTRLANNEVLTEQDSMSSFDVHICQHPEYLSQYLIELENQHRHFDLLLFWHKYENIFWKWMESVLDQPASTVGNHQSLSDMDCQRLEAEREKFNAAIDTLDDALVRLEQLWISNNDHRSIELDVTAIIASIDGQISSLFNQLLNKGCVLPNESHFNQLQISSN